MRRKTRLIFACGLAELFTCSFILRRVLPADDAENMLIVYGRKISMPPLHLEETLRFAPVFADFSRIIDLVGISDRVVTSPDEAQASAALAPYRELFLAADEVLVHTLWKQPERTFLDLCPNASIVLFDNGLESHMPKSVIADGADRSVSGVREKDRRRLSLALYTLGEFLPAQDFAQGTRIVVPDGPSLLSHLMEIGERGPFAHMQEQLSSDAEPCALLLGTSFFRTGRINLDQESGIYLASAHSLAEEGNFVVFKEHPRAPMPLIDSRRRDLRALRTSMPIEFIPALRKVSCSASMSSSGLLMLKKLYGVPYRLLGDAHAQTLKLPWTEILKRHASTIEDSAPLERR